MAWMPVHRSVRTDLDSGCPHRDVTKVHLVLLDAVIAPSNVSLPRTPRYLHPRHPTLGLPVEGSQAMTGSPPGAESEAGQESGPPQKPGAGQEMGYNDSSHKETPDGQWG